MQVQQKEDYYYSNFVNALKSKTTKNDYTKRLSYFMDFLEINNKNYNELVENKDKKWIENSIIRFSCVFDEIKEKYLINLQLITLMQ